MWTIPGTILQTNRAEAEYIPQQLEALFFGGGIALSQVTAITGLEAHTVQNWVKRGFLTSPVGKRYTLRQLCRILNINVLRCTMPIDRICHLLSYVNGELDDESDDLIDDSQLYFMFVRLAALVGQVNDPDAWDAFITREMEGYQEPAAGAAKRVETVLRIMLTAWASVRLQKKAEQMLCQIEEKE
jgi:DNA-binding transcriptional MerR regulator